MIAGGNRLYVRGRLLSSVALTQGGLDIFDGSKVWGLNECFQPWFMTMLVNVQLRLISFRVDPFLMRKKGLKNASAIEMTTFYSFKFVV